MMSYMKFYLLLSLSAVVCLILLYYNNPPKIDNQFFRPDLQQIFNRSSTYYKVELTLRLAATDKMIHRLMCDLLRSVALFWNADYGDIVLILDKEDTGNKLLNRINSTHLPHRFRFVYEDPPKRINEIAALARKNGKSPGYYRMFYSSFFMDLYTNEQSIIAWTDTDCILTMPIVRDDILRNNKLIVKGFNTFNLYSWISSWDKTTVLALGLNMVSDFMTYFPVYIYPSTIRNCRRYIMQRLNTTDFETAFLHFISQHSSPVNIILSYAYYFERHLYDWHIDIGHSKLHQYNEERLPNHPLLPKDITPETHVSVHSGYFKSSVHPLERALCYIHIHLKDNIQKFCEPFKLKVNFQLFVFTNDPLVSHEKTWCSGKEGNKTCVDMIEQRYEIVTQLYRAGKMKLNNDHISIVEKLALETFNKKCPEVKY